LKNYCLDILSSNQPYQIITGGLKNKRGRWPKAYTVSDLKLKIFRQIDSLESNRLEELYGVLLNFINEKKDIADWERLTEEQKQGIIDAIEEINLGKGIPNEKVMSEIRKKYSHA